MNKNKEKPVQVEIVKTANGYSIADKENNRIDFFEDDDEGRRAVVNYLILNVLNKELPNGRKYN
jgi:hypothetical protein